MIRLYRCSILIAAVICTSCSREDAARKAATASERDSDAPVQSKPGEVRLPADSPQLKRITVSAVATAEMPMEEVIAPGKIEAIPTHVSRVAMPVPGRVKRVMVGLGDAVRSNQVLLTFDSPETSTAISADQQASARQVQAKAALAKADADLARVRDLLEHRAIAQKEVISAEAALAQARSDLDQARAVVEETARRLDILGLKPGNFNQEIAIVTPVSGKVLEISVAAGEYRNDTSAPLMTIADLSSVHIAADVPESAIRLVRRGERIEVSLAAYPGETFRGRVARVADTVDPQTRTVKVMAELSNANGRLRPDMFGEIRHQEALRRMPVVPEGAVIQGQTRSTVWREKAPGHFEAVEVTFGKSRKGLLPILRGLEAGDRIVTDGAMLLQGNS